MKRILISIKSMRHRVRRLTHDGRKLIAEARGQNLRLLLSMVVKDKQAKSRYYWYPCRRGGEIIGDHTVMFIADGEVVRITIARARTFAAGAVRAATWVIQQKSGNIICRKYCWV
jgi:dihydrodipicolinate reductase